ncbi:MAG: phosphoribosylformylglycinamidine synthase [Desulfohalobiaceae bacterium]|nr:phosphoribosylformylglycinamidine synthase [Desulfohalobiaceae bacterium]
MLHRVAVGLRPGIEDVQGKGTARQIYTELGLNVDRVRIIRIYLLEGLPEDSVQESLDKGLLHDPVLQEASLSPLALDFDWILEVGFKPGVTDNEGRVARETLKNGLRLDTDTGYAVYTSTQYCLSGNLSPEEVRSIAADLLANELIQRYHFKSKDEWDLEPGFAAEIPRVTGSSSDRVETVCLSGLSDQELDQLSRDRVLALNLSELKCIQAYYARPKIRQDRLEKGLPEEPTDAELEVLAQTWSEHCKHKIFNARIRYEDREQGRMEEVDSLFRTCIQNPTSTLRSRLGKDDFCLSVFKDNAGVIRFDRDYSVCIKVETHNSPSALDPYGGALTGIVGVNRDPMGTGLGANLICNTDVFCFASPFYRDSLPPRLLHPHRVMEGVRRGVEHGGNQSGIPTVNGGLVFDERYLGKPLVFCGTVGLMPARIQGRASHEKQALPGDRVVMVGGRVGKDGIHGATFSSEALHAGSPATAVQIGDPITQRKMYDFLMRARNQGLYNAITDNGAGGLSSSVGEMAEDTGGCELDLARVPLKYDGLFPWEILLSEAQERMTVAVPEKHLADFLELAREMDVEATDLGRFSESGFFRVRFNERLVAELEMDFMHHGLPQMELEAVWEKPASAPFQLREDQRVQRQGMLRRMLGRLNICSRESIIRQYDHEVQGGSVIKPLVGALYDGPGDAAVLRPVLERDRGLVVSNGICPKYSDQDTYWMMANAVDEAIRNNVAVGGDIRHMAGVDNFCWCDPVVSEKTPDGRYKLAQLVRANRGLADFCLGFGVPCISGKDSMKNDYSMGDIKISIPPTVLFSVISVIPDVTRTVTSDLKKSGDLIYLLGLTREELGQSELASELGIEGGLIPQVDLLSSRQRYLCLHQGITRGLITACHDLSDGGLGVALAEMCIGGDQGAEIDIQKVPVIGEGLGPEEILYSESAGRLLVTVSPGSRQEFERLFAGQTLSCLGRVRQDREFKMLEAGRVLFVDTVGELRQAWQKTLNF